VSVNSPLNKRIVRRTVRRRAAADMSLQRYRDRREEKNESWNKPGLQGKPAYASSSSAASRCFVGSVQANCGMFTHTAAPGALEIGGPWMPMFESITFA